MIVCNTVQHHVHVRVFKASEMNKGKRNYGKLLKMMYLDNNFTDFILLMVITDVHNINIYNIASHNFQFPFLFPMYHSYLFFKVLIMKFIHKIE